MYPLVDIIIPSYNSRQWVCDSIESVLKQTYDNIQIIVVDDGSTDGTGELLKKKYAGRIQYVSQANSGLSGARNTGILHANGEFIQFLDADDTLHPDKLRLQVEVLMSNPAYSIVYSDFEYFSDEEPKKTWPSLQAYKVKCHNSDVLFSFLSGNFIVCHAALIRKKALLNVGMFDESLRACEDFDLWIRFAALGHKFVYLDHVLAYYRQHDSSMSRSRVRQVESTLQVHKRIRRFKQYLNSHEDFEYRHYQAYLHREAARLYREQKHGRLLLFHLLMAIKFVPSEMRHSFRKVFS